MALKKTRLISSLFREWMEGANPYKDLLGTTLDAAWEITKPTSCVKRKMKVHIKLIIG